MNEMTIRLERNGAAAVPGGQLLLGYAGNRGNYRLRIEQRGEWKGLTVCAHWHTPGASAATLVENGVLTVPAAVTAVPGVGCKLRCLRPNPWAPRRPQAKRACNQSLQHPVQPQNRRPHAVRQRLPPPRRQHQLQRL